MGYFDTPEATADTNTEKTYEPIPEGNYTVKLYDVEIDLDYKTKAGEAAPRVSLTWLFDDKRKAWSNVMFKENMRWKVKEFVDGMGIEAEMEKKMPGDNPSDMVAAQVFYDIVKNAIDKKFDVDTSNREYNGKIYTDVAVNMMVKGSSAVKNFAPTKEQLTNEDMPF